MSGQNNVAELAVIGGSGFYRLVDDVRSVELSTPYGPPSAPVTIGAVAGRAVAFIPRHGTEHEYPPHAVPYQANLHALGQLGVRQILAPCAAGSLRPEIGPGALVLPDQLVDRTRGRTQSFHDRFEGPAVHVAFADPYCARLRNATLTAAHSHGWLAQDGGTMVVVDGPRFSTRAESHWHAAQGWTLVNMTGVPEAVLARELGMCYQPLALVTDHDSGLSDASAATSQDVFAVFATHVQRLRQVIATTLESLALQPTCDCCR